jgi:hypothetical protein
MGSRRGRKTAQEFYCASGYTEDVPPDRRDARRRCGDDCIGDRPSGAWRDDFGGETEPAAKVGA